MDTNTVKVIETFGNKLDGYIEALASKLGLAADHFWPVFVQQQYIEGWVMIVATIILAVLTGLLFRTAIKNTKDKADDATIAKASVTYITGAISAIVLLVVCVQEFPTAIGKIANPEYYAVQSLVKMVK